MINKNILFDLSGIILYVDKAALKRHWLKEDTQKTRRKKTKVIFSLYP